MSSDKEFVGALQISLQDLPEPKRKFKSRPTKWLLVILFAMASNLLYTGICQAQTKQRILIFTGGHDFERTPFFDMFGDFRDLDYQELVHLNLTPVFDSVLIAQYDVLLFYDMVQNISPKQKAALLKILERGKGMVFLHHSLASYQEWDEFEKIIGGRYVLNNDNQDSSTYKHGVDIAVTIPDKEHPITRDLDDFIIHDEVYGNFRVRPDVHPLLKTSHPESGEIIAWTNEYASSRIVYIQLGHDHHAYENQNFRRLLKEAIDWVQHDEPPMIQFSPDFKFKDGIYLSIDKLRENKPIPLARIITDIGPYNKDFIREMLSNEQIMIYDDYGIRRTVQTRYVWGYAESGRLYIMLGGKFQRITIQGSISLFTASETTHQKAKYPQGDTSRYFSSTEDLHRSFYRKKYHNVNVTGERQEYLFDFESNTLNGFHFEDLGKLLERDTVLYSEYASLKIRDKKKRMLEFMRRYNQSHPLYFPDN